MLLIGAAINSFAERAAQREAAEQAEKNAQERRDREAAEKLAEDQRIATEAAARDVRLRAEAEPLAAAFNKSLDDVRASIAASEWQEAKKQLDVLTPDADSFKALTPIPPEYHGVLERYTRCMPKSRRSPHSRQSWRTPASCPPAPINSRPGRRTVRRGRRRSLCGSKPSRTVEAVESSDPSIRSHVSGDSRRCVDRSGRASTETHRYADPYERELAELAALKVVCGAAPVGCGGGWDGECIGTKSAFKQIAHDPGSVDVENCSAPVLTKKHCWISKCTVRAKNSFGAKIATTHTFSFSALGIEVID